MAKKFKKEILTLEEIGAIILERTEGRYKNLNSAYTAAKKAANILGIEDINGKKRNKLIAAKDAEAIIAYILEPKQEQKPAKVEVKPFPVETSPKSNQVSIFDFIEPLEVPVDASINKGEVYCLAPKAEETIEALEEFKKARNRLEALIGQKLIVYFKDYYI